MKKINVVHVFNTYPGGNTTNWLFNLIKNLPLCNVIIAAKFFTKHNFYSNQFTYIENPLASIMQYERSLKKWSLKLPQKLLFFFAEKVLLNFKKYLNKEISKMNADIIHAHFANVGCEYAYLTTNKNIPFVVSFYGYDYEYLPHTQPVYKKKYPELFIKADKFICEGTFGASILRKIGCPEEKIAIVKLGVEIDTIPFVAKEKKENSLRLVQIATFREKKGHIYTVKAFHAALDKCPDMHLTLVGSGDEIIQNELTAFIQKNGLSQKVEIISEIDYNTLHNFLTRFDVFIHPSCYSVDKDCEGGAPIVLLDAQACGLPVISTTHCDIPDEVVHSKTGFLSPEKDVKSLSDFICSFYKMNLEEYKTFSIAARKHIEENYSITKNAIVLREVYDSLI